MEHTPLILSLIKEDLKLNAFINSMNKAGLIVECYSPLLSEAIFKLADAPHECDELYDLYWNFMEGLEYTYVTENLELLSAKFYAELVAFCRLHTHCRRQIRQAC